MENLGKLVQDVEGMDWGFTTNFQSVLYLLFDSAQSYSAKPEEMIKLLFCFSDI